MAELTRSNRIRLPDIFERFDKSKFGPLSEIKNVKSEGDMSTVSSVHCTTSTKHIKWNDDPQCHLNVLYTPKSFQLHRSKSDCELYSPVEYPISRNFSSDDLCIQKRRASTIGAPLPND